MGKPGYPGGLIIVAVLLAERLASNWETRRAVVQNDRRAICDRESPPPATFSLNNQKQENVSECELLLNSRGKIEVDPATLSCFSKFEFHA